MKIEVTAKEIKSLYDEFNAIEWLLGGTKFSVNIERFDQMGASGLSHKTKDNVKVELAEIAIKMLEKRRKEILDRFEQLKLPIE